MCSPLPGTTQESRHASTPEKTRVRDDAGHVAHWVGHPGRRDLWCHQHLDVGPLYSYAMGGSAYLWHRARWHLRPHRPGLYAGVRHPAYDQLCPQRGVYGRPLHRLLCGDRHEPGRLVRPWLGAHHSRFGHRPPDRHGRITGDRRHAGTDRLPAAAPGSPPGAADHRHRRFLLSPIHLSRPVWLERQGVS